MAINKAWIVPRLGREKHDDLIAVSASETNPIYDHDMCVCVGGEGRGYLSEHYDNMEREGEGGGGREGWEYFQIQSSFNNLYTYEATRIVDLLESLGRNLPRATLKPGCFMWNHNYVFGEWDPLSYHILWRELGHEAHWKWGLCGNHSANRTEAYSNL